MIPIYLPLLILSMSTLLLLIRQVLIDMDGLIVHHRLIFSMICRHFLSWTCHVSNWDTTGTNLEWSLPHMRLRFVRTRGLRTTGTNICGWSSGALLLVIRLKNMWLICKFLRWMINGYVMRWNLATSQPRTCSIDIIRGILDGLLDRLWMLMLSFVHTTHQLLFFFLGLIHHLMLLMSHQSLLFLNTVTLSASLHLTRIEIYLHIGWQFALITDWDIRSLWCELINSTDGLKSIVCSTGISLLI